MWCYVHTGSYDYFMQKEIFEQPESVVNTMRGRVNFTMETGVCSACVWYSVSLFVYSVVCHDYVCM